MKRKRIKLEDCVIGQEYFVSCGVWSGHVTYVGIVSLFGKSHPLFTFGSFDNWENQFNLHAPKSHFKIWKDEVLHA